jgi:hypothetical protein
MAMSASCQLERELAHISAMIALLRDRVALDANNPVMDPAYWRARIRNAAREAPLDSVLQQRVINLIAKLDAIPAASASAKQEHKRSRARHR